MPVGRAELTAADRLRVALVGCGAMGSRHARVIASDPRSELAVAIDVLPERAEAVARATGARVERAVPHEVDVVVVATPTTTHHAVAGPLLDRGQWCLVEKPLAGSLDGALRLRSERCAVAHVERFNPAVRSAGALRPQVVEARRISPPTGRGTDVDVVLDLMIHDLDLVLAWAAPGSEVAWVDAAGVAVMSEGVDTASVRFRTSCGITATLLASRVAEHRQRVVRCYERGRYTVLDLLAGAAHRDGRELERDDPRDALTCQWEAFSGAARGERALEATGEAGLRAVELAERIRSAIGEGA